MNYLLWAQLVSNLAGAIAASQGKDTRAIGYFSLVTNTANLAALTDADLTALHEKYALEVANKTETTAEELEAIAASLQARSAQIQAS
jgi:uncharacterized protein YdbL (DUF1318 family)